MDDAESGELGNNYGKLTLNFLKFYWKLLFVIIYPLICLPILLGPWSMPGFEGSKFRCLYTLIVMAGYWLTEAVPVYITGMMPIFMFPLLNIMNSDQTTACYFKEVNMMFLGSLFITSAVEYSRLHVRVALFVILKVGCNPRSLHLSLLMTTALMSFWMMNTAVTAMMCPIVKAILEELELQGIGTRYRPQTEEDIINEELPRPSNPAIAYYLGISYASTIGGLGTLIGTGTTLTYKGILDTAYPNGGGDTVEFVNWMLYGAPVVILNCLFICFWLQVCFMGMFQPKSADGEYVRDAEEKKDEIKAVIQNKYKELGSMHWHESWVGIFFIIAVLLWFFRSPKFFTGWGDALTGDYHAPHVTFMKNSVVAMLIVFILILFPSTKECFYGCSKHPERRPTKSYTGLVTWKYLGTSMQWGLLFLLGGGFALAAGGKESGMTEWIGLKLKVFQNLNQYFIMAITTAATSILTEITSNIATCNIIIPIMFSMASQMNINPIFLGHPAAIACSYSFLLPIATPPNAMVSGYANIKTIDMVKGGSVIKLVTYLLTIISFVSYGRLFWKSDVLPDWALKFTDNRKVVI